AIISENSRTRTPARGPSMSATLDQSFGWYSGEDAVIHRSCIRIDATTTPDSSAAAMSYQTYSVLGLAPAATTDPVTWDSVSSITGPGWGRISVAPERAAADRGWGPVPPPPLRLRRTMDGGVAAGPPQGQARV